MGIDVKTNSRECTGCEHVYRIKVVKENGKYYIEPSGYTSGNVYSLAWWWTRINDNYVGPQEIVSYY